MLYVWLFELAKQRNEDTSIHKVVKSYTKVCHAGYLKT